MPEPVSSLGAAGSPRTVLPKGVDAPGVRLSERPVGTLWQVTAWPDGLAAAAEAVARAAKAEKAPGPRRAVEGAAALALRTDPLRWWLLSEQPRSRPELAADAGTVLDLSHARTRLRIEGPRRVDLLARLAAVDFRDGAFPEGSVATAPMHHVAVTVLARPGGTELFVQRTLARSVFEHIAEVAGQFGVEIA